MDGLSQTDFSIHGLVSVRMRWAESDLARDIASELSYFRVDSLAGEPDIDLEVTDAPVGQEFRDVVALGDGYFCDRESGALVSTGLGGGSLYKPENARFAVYGDLLNANRFRIRLRAPGRTDPIHRRSFRAFLKCDPMTLGAADAARFFYRVFEPLLYFILPSRGATLLHAAAVARGDRGAIIFGVRDVGKTSTTIDLVRRGYSFMSDDLCILRSDGALLAYPKPMKIEGDLLEKREWTSLYEKRLSAADRWAWYLAYHSPRRKPFWLSLKLLPWQLGDVTMQREAKADEAIFLWKSNRSEPEIRAVDRRSAAEDAVSHVVYEFNGMPRHHAYFHALALLRRSSAHDIDADHIRKIRAIVETGLAGATAREISLGQDDNFVTSSRLIREPHEAADAVREPAATQRAPAAAD